MYVLDGLYFLEAIFCKNRNGKLTFNNSKNIFKYFFLILTKYKN